MKFFCQYSDNWLWVFKTVGDVFYTGEDFPIRVTTLRMFEELETFLPPIIRDDLIYDLLQNQNDP